MAKMPPAATPAMPDDQDTDTDAGAAAPGADSQDAGDDDAGTPICTIMGHSDGTFSLVKGDGDDDEGPGGPDGGAPPAPGAGGDEDQGQSFTDLGDLLKGVMLAVKDFQASNGGSTDQQNFEAGYAGSDTSGPLAPPSPSPKAP